MLKKVSLLTLSAVSVFAMHSAEINVNNTDLELSAKFDIGQVNEKVEPNTIFIGAKYLNVDERHSDISNVDDYYEANFLMMKNASKDLKIGLGVKLNHTKDFTSAPLGVEAAYKLPIESSVPFYVGGSLYYAPRVLAFEKADNYLEYRVTVDAEVIKNGFVTVGFRDMNTNYESGNVEYNKSFYGGFRFLF
ncbi:hypothetical protein [Sulfurimonas sp.]|uniref:hypothetical protein n=1 Tax=Sulfurimonas sp. TaxID=2022749 RepID=UPI0025D40D27|nr:hypothetical protein [Sulfurimonas sp.]MDD5156431.1 hypothetical protein [Sulfurimonas sp.]